MEKNIEKGYVETLQRKKAACVGTTWSWIRQNYHFWQNYI